VTKRSRISTAATAALAAFALAVLLAGCGDASPSETPSTIYPESSATGTLPALKAYLTDAREVLDQVGTTVGALPGAVADMSRTPDDTWTASSAQLWSIATQLEDEAAALSALEPPSGLAPVQDAVVAGIQAAQKGVEKLATQLDSRAESAATRKAQVQAKAAELKAQLDGLAQQLKSALEGLTGQ
jgi:chaperonin cofactor prefoldin